MLWTNVFASLLGCSTARRTAARGLMALRTFGMYFTFPLFQQQAWG